ncbi:alpha/beta hydrolase [Actinomadura craniellae]|uniref:Poly(ethylene terephthalate) hydrolase n=1 Tax=Actinomadura craniellae TaxID=2231787 RepID=A0A365H682_9ACTN|nr:dienelactone hydrolase family protein [Actinomadura craniellae]RAY14630.1 alpha/beta hydrolase [Actinomadura craniellae]
MRKTFKLIPAVVALAAGLATAPVAQATAASPYAKGPDPTEASVTASRGPFATATTSVRSYSHPGFNSGTIYYPTDTSQGTFGAIAVIPGFLSPESSVSWYGQRLASQGFVVMTLETSSGFDQPDQRANQLLGALDYLTTSSSVRSRIDVNRLGVMGWSMGGGGTLRAAERGTGIKAAIPLAPWHTNQNWRSVRVPTMIIGADNDTIAGTGAHAEPFYNNLTGARDRAYLELNNADHFTFTSSNTTIAKYSISWMKRFLDDDTRYDRFLCPAPSPSSTIQEYRNSCPHS